ncbi:Tyrosine-protein phosphatase non-receptor type 14 [Nymphon striatum]|nr:Tyrosine-protein phosphatase non-receptor type 14 [Nymphon striatum]
MPDVIQRKFLKLSSTLKETSRYLNDIDRVVFEHKNLEKQRNEEIFQLKADLHSTLERLQVADVSIAADHVMEMGVNKHTPSLISDEEVIEEEDRPDCSSLISNQVSQKKSNELECDSKAFEVKYNALNEKYIAMKKKARKIIQNWKEKYRSAEIIIEKQEKIIGDLHTMNIEMSESKSKLQDEVDSFTEKTVTACYSVERIGELENKMLFISERHKIFLKEIEDLKVSLHQENLVVKETKQQNNVLNLNINASEKANEDLKKELALSNESLMKLQNEKLTLDFKGQTLQKSLSEKENQILEMDKRLEDLKKDVESSKESVITDKEYLNILRSFNNELDIATELISKNSKETFQSFKMPFKLKLKKSKQYNVASKNMYVVSVELLDNTVVECTLSAESTGLDCLNNVCQRLSLCQSEYFGLKFLTKKRVLHWVELDRPLKKQLEKFCHDTYMAKLFLGVQYYVNDVQHLQDEITRYQYFLQLKTKIINGYLLCNPEQAVLLASYSLQAEFGDHDPERHTAQYLREFVLLPKHLTNDENKLKELIEKVAQSHRSLQSLVPSLAEVYYIVECQQLEGYGQEFYSGKDESGNELIVSPSLSGILLKRLNKEESTFFRYGHVHLSGKNGANLNKIKLRTPGMTSMNSVDAQLNEYTIKVIEYLDNEFSSMQSPPFNLFIVFDHREMPNLAMQISQMLQSESDLSPQPSSSPNNNNTDFNQSLEDISSSFNNDDSKQYENRQRTYSLRVNSSTYDNNHSSLGNSFNSVNRSCQNNVIQNSISTANLEMVKINDMAPVSSSVSLPGLVPVAHQISTADNELEQRKQACLPAYRPAPDYETAMRHKYRSNDASMLRMTDQPLGMFDFL